MAKKKRNRFSRGRDKAKAMAKKRIGTGTPKKPNRTIKSIFGANIKRIQDNARERDKKFKQTRVQTFGGIRGIFNKAEQRRIKKAGYEVAGYSKAKFKPTPKPKPAPKPTPKPKPKVNAVDRNELKTDTEIARFKSKYPAADSDNMSTKEFREMMLPGLRDVVPGESLRDTQIRLRNNDLLSQNQGPVSNIRYDSSTGRMEYYGGATGVKGTRLKTPMPGPDVKLTASSLTGITGLGIGDAKATGYTPNVPGLAKSLGIDSTTGVDSEGKGPRYLSIKSAESFGAPSQAAVDKAAGITAGGLNIGGGGFTLTNRSGGSTSRALRDIISDVEPRAAGPNDSVGKAPTLTRRKRRGGGGARLPVAPLTPEEILLPEKTAVAQAAPVSQQAAPVYQQAIPEQTGLDSNRLLQIQQEAYQQAFNPYDPMTVGGFNPFFRFFNRRGGIRRGAFRRAFRRD